MLSNILTPTIISLPDADGHYNPFPAYPFTGPLRPVYPLSARRTIPERIRHTEYAHNGIPKSEQVGRQLMKLWSSYEINGWLRHSLDVTNSRLSTTKNKKE